MDLLIQELEWEKDNMVVDENKYTNIPSEKFEFVNSGEKIHDTKFETKPIGYFKDALIRFCKNRASVAAFVIIILIVFNCY